MNNSWQYSEKKSLFAYYQREGRTLLYPFIVKTSRILYLIRKMQERKVSLNFFSSFSYIRILSNSWKRVSYHRSILPEEILLLFFTPSRVVRGNGARENVEKL